MTTKTIRTSSEELKPSKEPQNNRKDLRNLVIDFTETSNTTCRTYRTTFRTSAPDYNLLKDLHNLLKVH